MTIEELIGFAAGIFTTLAVIPQIVKAIKTKKVEDVSPFMFLILCIGVGLWTVYGVLKEDLPIIITNGISFILNATMLSVAIIKNKE